MPPCKAEVVEYRQMRPAYFWRRQNLFFLILGFDFETFLFLSPQIPLSKYSRAQLPVEHTFLKNVE